MNTSLAPFAALAAIALFATACTVDTDADSASVPQTSPDDRISCITRHHHTMTCTALDPYDGTKTSCQDDVKRKDCEDDYDSDYGGGCFFSDTWSCTVIKDQDCATYAETTGTVFDN